MSFDWSTFLNAPSDITIVVVVVGVACWLVKRYFEKEIETAVQSKYDALLENLKTENQKEIKSLEAKNQKELEGFKLGYQKVLDENKIRYSKLYAEQAETIKDLYKKLIKLNNPLQEYVGPDFHLNKSADDNQRLDLKIAIVKAHKAFHDDFLNNEIIIPAYLETNIRTLLNTAKEIIDQCNESELYANGCPMEAIEMRKVAYDKFNTEFEKTLVQLKKSFRAILEGKGETDADLSCPLCLAPQPIEGASK